MFVTPCGERSDVAGGDSLVAHPRGCRPRCEVCCRDTRPAMSSVGQPFTGRSRSAAPEGPREWNGAERDDPAAGARKYRGAVPTTDQFDPGRPGVVPVRGRRRPGAVRGEGEVAAAPAAELLAGPPRPAATDRPDGGGGGPRGVGGGGHRGRSADVGVLPHPDPPAPVQRPAEGRQELPVAGGDGGGGVAAADRVPGAEAEGGAVLRAVRPRRGPPGDPGPAAAELPGADVLGGEVQAARPAGAAVPAVRHRTVLGAVRGGDRPRPVPRDGGRPDGVPVRRQPAGDGAAGDRDGGGRGGPGVRAGRPAAGPADGGAEGGGDPADGVGAAGGLRRGGIGHRRPGGGGAGVPRPPRPGGRPGWVRGRQGGGPHGGAAPRPGGGAAVRGGRRGGPPAGAGA